MNKENEAWLRLAVSRERPNLMNPHGCAAADGVRMHIVNGEDACICGDEKRHESFDRVIEGASKSPFAFAINKHYLLDAIAGFDNTDMLLFFMEPGGKAPVVMQNIIATRTAIIMPMRAGDDVDKPENMPKVKRQLPRINRTQIVLGEEYENE